MTLFPLPGLSSEIGDVWTEIIRLRRRHSVKVGVGARDRTEL